MRTCTMPEKNLDHLFVNQHQGPLRVQVVGKPGRMITLSSGTLLKYALTAHEQNTGESPDITDPKNLPWSIISFDKGRKSLMIQEK